MADGYLESHYAEYEKKKAEWLRRKHKYQPHLADHITLSHNGKDSKLTSR